MVSSIWEDIKRQYSFGNMVTRLVIINVAVFVVINLIWVVLRIGYGWSDNGMHIYESIRQFFMLSSDWLHNLTHPWVFITSMFLHDGFWHILWNMLFLYWFGRIVGDFLGNHRVLPLYLLGGIVGGLAYFISVNLLPYGGNATHYALGASGAVMAFVVAAGFISPDYYMRLLFLGDVKLKYIVAVLVLIDLIGMASNINTGGHFAHLGGAFFGWFFVYQLRQGTDWSIPVNNFLDKIRHFFDNLSTSRQSRGPRVTYRNPNRTKKTATRTRGKAASDTRPSSHQEELDAILDKIKQSGYESLSEKEKEFLFNASKK
ncbi:rhomboid family protein [Flavilitoribacter nigricans]|uniref:Rhomboid family intramembrane serine protease n=1 Tax=Flavilitoribacter nigricans (strain ATCC 23147 / DSM 23189 / NBRC 102662 / NCIMB 1420 / SS-2) TaxID=1122177 RepID=A0A2D0NAD9_FLAN2|nr:rhomboid family intramembrane serine protease [Flavilitoribacter nigricans]PHN05482.1 rhomboid family intramembrane serine protease [Flavilitoribacter nigricans DSM 23189 = NBRC 102662]